MSELKQTDLSKHLRELARRLVTPYETAKVMLDAAEEIERYYTCMLDWKTAAEAKDREFAARRTQPEAAAPAQDLSAAILKLPCKMLDYRNYAMGSSERGPHRDGYRAGHRAALKAAAALASSANALSAVDRVDAVKFLLKRERRDAQLLASLLAKERARFEFLHSTNCDDEGWEWGVARVRRAADGRIEYLWGLADHSDIDAILAATNRSQPCEKS